MRDLQARLGFLVIRHSRGNVKCTPSTALDNFFDRHFAHSRFRDERPRARCIACSDGVPWLAAISSHLVTKLHHAALVGFDLCKVEGEVSVELLAEWGPITSQDRKDRITNCVG